MGLTLGRMVSNYNRARSAQLAPTTRRVHRCVLASFVSFTGDQVLVTRVRRTHVEGWLTHLQDRGNSPSTIGSRLSVVRNLFKWAMLSEHVRRDPTFGVIGPRRPTTKARALSAPEVSQLLSHSDARTSLILLLGLQEGLRRAEIAGLRVSDLDFSKRVVEVHGKGGKTRWVPLSDETKSAVDEYLTERPAGPHLPLIRSEGYHSNNGITPDRVGLLAAFAFKAAGLKQRPWDGRSLHAMRHTCAVDVLERGADIRDVADLLGHADVSLTLSVYGRRAAAVGRLRQIVEGRQYGGSGTPGRVGSSTRF